MFLFFIFSACFFTSSLLFKAFFNSKIPNNNIKIDDGIKIIKNNVLVISLSKNKVNEIIVIIVIRLTYLLYFDILSLPFVWKVSFFV